MNKSVKNKRKSELTIVVIYKNSKLNKIRKLNVWKYFKIKITNKFFFNNKSLSLKKNA